jgi:hypothetical protein
MRQLTRYTLLFLAFLVLMRLMPVLSLSTQDATTALSESFEDFVFFVPNLLAADPLLPFLILGAGSLCYGIGRMACTSRLVRRIFDEELGPRKPSVPHVGFEADKPLLNEQDFFRIIAALANPEDELPEQPVDPTPRALTDGAWDAWGEAGQWRNGLPALDRSFTLRTDCQSGHVAEHHVGEHWEESGTGRTRVTRVCRYLCHSTWSEIV